MKLRLRYIFSVLLLVAGAHTLFAQKADSVVMVKRSGLAVSLDYGKLFTLPSDFESKWAFGVGYRIKSKWMINIVLGKATLEPKNAIENGTYKSEGMFGSAGLNYMLPLDATNTLYFGVRYGMSMYEDEYNFTVGSSIWPDFIYSEAHKDLQANWFGITFGSEKQFKKLDHFYLGGSLTLRILSSYDQFEPFDTYAIPGYGRTADNTVPGFNAYIKYLF